MSLLPIITLPDPLLRTLSTPVERFDADLAKLADNMLETMYDAPGVGLAAIQVGVPKRLLVIDVGDESDEEESADLDATTDDPAADGKPETPVVRRPFVLVNPRILTLGDHSRVYEEGCLSIPDVRIDIERPSSIVVGYQDASGASHELAADGLLATAIQHEIDHLDGRLIIDFLTRLKRDMIVRRFKKQSRIG